MGANEKLIQSVESWRNIVEINAKNDTLNAFADAIVSSSPDIDKTSGWALGAAGAIAGLIITNIDKLAKFFDIAEIKILLVALIISILCGLAQKLLASLCAVHLKVKEVTSVKLKEILTVFESSESSITEMATEHKLDIVVEFDIEAVMQRFVEISPFYIKWLIKKESYKSMADPEYSPKKVLATFYRQNLWVFLQTISFVSFIMFSVLFL
ncbi:hypothetical protein [uncultured Shewanella sp.]|uniref:hypothetical protein n=1 Tax=uncultured Shewanella sp. TaxID=173975 RepID=UPI002608AF6A|nr:hypothetical protein [uncultured Shewanella sp.]